VSAALQTNARTTAKASVSAHVARWVDGDTLHVTIAGHDVVVRLLGAGAPETRPTAACGAAAATRLARRVLPVGSPVRVTTDKASGAVQDAFGRRLGYVDGGGDDVGERLIATGRATVYRFDGRHFSRLRRYESAQRAARAARRGSWRHCPRFGHARRR